ncbi:phosphotransferase [Glycomyces sp. NPDC047010]|uniref:phosphotransferase family protein n=1 Tax=Glycomyces sp. NPDC047010 TaxID=3155023 RepID=UPI0033E9FD10
MWKPRFTLDDIAAAVAEGHRPLADWQPLTEGENSQVFAAEDGDRQVVVRACKRRDGFDVEARVAAMLAGSAVRAPETVAIGPVGDAWWSVTTRLPGVRLCDLPPDRVADAAESVAEAMRRIHTADVTASTGFGGIDPATGNGRQSAWHDPVPGPGAWSALSFEDRKLVDALTDLYTTDAAALPEQRALLHGDFSADNLIVDGDAVGVIDFECARYGDPLWDIAYQLFWAGPWPVMAPQARAAAAGLDDSADTRARLRLHMTAAGLNGAAFYAHDDRVPELQLMLRRLAPLLEDPPSLSGLDGYWIHPGR